MKLMSSEDVQKQYIEGIKKLSEKVGSTLGPRGQTVAIQKSGCTPFLSKDGVTVAKFVDLTEPFENLAAQILKEASIKTSAQAGDGTTTTIVLAEAFYRGCIAACVTQSINPIQLKRKIDEYLTKFVTIIKANSIPIKSEKDILDVATISSNNDPNIGNLIAQAFLAAGRDGTIRIDSSNNSMDTLNITEGYQMMSGYITSKFINNPTKHTVEFDNPLIAITDETLESVDQIFPALQIAAKLEKPLVIIANSIEDEALASMIVNITKGTMKLVPINAPNYFGNKSEILEDIAIVLGGEVMNPISLRSLSEITLSDFGKCKKIVISKNQTIFVEGNNSRENVLKRIELLDSQMEENSDLHECEVIQERISKLGSCVVTIKIGSPTEIERTEKFYRVEDALEAVKAAIQDGILPGGGIALIKLFKKIQAPRNQMSLDSMAYAIFAEAIQEPLKLMLKNAGLSVESILDKVMNSKDFYYGYDIYNEKYCNMIEMGIIDPVKVIESALTNAISVATTLMTSKHAIIQI